jgi:hypothetical protein
VWSENPGFLEMQEVHCHSRDRCNPLHISENSANPTLRRQARAPAHEALEMEPTTVIAACADRFTSKQGVENGIRFGNVGFNRLGRSVQADRCPGIRQRAGV